MLWGRTFDITGSAAFCAVRVDGWVGRLVTTEEWQMGNCEYCDGTGDVSNQVGEYLGPCNCGAPSQFQAEMAACDERINKPPCLECGAMTQEDAETKCRCGGDKDSCHGTTLWPD